VWHGGPARQSPRHLRYLSPDAEHRGHGYGKQMMLNLLAWGKRNGARAAYLQVMLNNPSGTASCYEKLGFQEAYQYWYRVLT